MTFRPEAPACAGVDEQVKEPGPAAVALRGLCPRCAAKTLYGPGQLRAQVPRLRARFRRLQRRRRPGGFPDPDRRRADHRPCRRARAGRRAAFLGPCPALAAADRARGGRLAPARQGPAAGARISPSRPRGADIRHDRRAAAVIAGRGRDHRLADRPGERRAGRTAGASAAPWFVLIFVVAIGYAFAFDRFARRRALMRFPLIPTILVAAAVATMIALGIWQLRRADEKEALQRRYERNLALPPMALPPAAVADETLLYRRATAFCLEVTAGGRPAASPPRARAAPASSPSAGPAPKARASRRTWACRPIRRRGPAWKGGEVAGRIVAEPAPAACSSG